MDWTVFFQLFVSALGGGLTVKLLDIVYREFKERSSAKRTAKSFLDDHLDPLLKAANELSGKLRYLASKDFRPIYDIDPFSPDSKSNHDYTGLIYLCGRFWAEIEIFRRDGVSVSMSSDERGSKLLAFLDCLESQRVRIVERVVLRAIGETLVEGHRVRPFIDFTNSIYDDDWDDIWVQELTKFVSRLKHTTERQRMLAYSTVLHAMIDTLDTEHTVTNDRPALPGKLSKKTWRDLNYRVFSVYLKFVKNRRKYIGPPK
ncbi:MAG: hypothetical protein ACU0DI_09750 [Paracoccaceae bacterium]